MSWLEDHDIRSKTVKRLGVNILPYQKYKTKKMVIICRIRLIIKMFP